MNATAAHTLIEVYCDDPRHKRTQKLATFARYPREEILYSCPLCSLMHSTNGAEWHQSCVYFSKQGTLELRTDGHQPIYENGGTGDLVTLIDVNQAEEMLKRNARETHETFSDYPEEPPQLGPRRRGHEGFDRHAPGVDIPGLLEGDMSPERVQSSSRIKLKCRACQSNIALVEKNLSRVLDRLAQAAVPFAGVRGIGRLEQVREWQPKTVHEANLGKPLDCWRAVRDEPGPDVDLRFSQASLMTLHREFAKITSN